MQACYYHDNPSPQPLRDTIYIMYPGCSPPKLGRWPESKPFKVRCSEHSRANMALSSSSSCDSDLCHSGMKGTYWPPKPMYLGVEEVGLINSYCLMLLLHPFPHKSLASSDPDILEGKIVRDAHLQMHIDQVSVSQIYNGQLSQRFSICLESALVSNWPTRDSQIRKTSPARVGDMPQRVE